MAVTRLLALLAVATAEKANGKYSQKQAQCLLKDRKIAILGDSNSRYWSLSFNQFLDQGILLNCYNKKGCTDRKTHDKYEIWTQAYGRSGDGTHLQRMTKTKFSGNGPKQTDYWFIQTTWFGDDTGKPMNGHKPNMNSIADLSHTAHESKFRGAFASTPTPSTRRSLVPMRRLKKEKYDLVIINSGWWDLKAWGEKDRGYDKCGEKWGGDCVKAYERDVQSVVDNLFDGRAGVFRESSCCGDYKSKADGKSVDSMNGVAEKVIKKNGYGFAKVFDLYDKDSVKDSTVDGTHAIPEFYLEWTMRVLEEAEAQLRTGCLGGGGGGPSPRPRPSPRPEPTRKPTDKPVKTPKPVREPTKKPTKAPTYKCPAAPTYRESAHSRRVPQADAQAHQGAAPGPAPRAAPDAGADARAHEEAHGQARREPEPDAQPYSETNAAPDATADATADAAARPARHADAEPVACRVLSGRNLRRDAIASTASITPQLTARIPRRTRPPTEQPTRQPSRQPTDKPVAEPADDDDDDDDRGDDDDNQETAKPSERPTLEPSDRPTSRPTRAPRPTAPSCPRVVLIDENDCPSDLDLPFCSEADMGQFCLGDDACADSSRTNCGRRRRLQEDDDQSKTAAVYRVTAPGSSPSGSKKKSDGGMEPWVVVLIVLCVILGLGVCLACLALLYCRKPQYEVKARALPRDMRRQSSRTTVKTTISSLGSGGIEDRDDDMSRIQKLRAKKGLPMLDEESKVEQPLPLPAPLVTETPPNASYETHDRLRQLRAQDESWSVPYGAPVGAAWYDAASRKNRDDPPPYDENYDGPHATYVDPYALGSGRSALSERRIERYPTDGAVVPVPLSSRKPTPRRTASDRRIERYPTDDAVVPTPRRADSYKPREDRAFRPIAVRPPPGDRARARSPATTSQRSPAYYREVAAGAPSSRYSSRSASPASLGGADRWTRKSVASPMARHVSPATHASPMRGAAYDSLVMRASDKQRTDRVATYATCVEAFAATRRGELELRKGDKVTILESTDSLWWRGSVGSRRGLFPCACVDNVSTARDDEGYARYRI